MAQERSCWICRFSYLLRTKLSQYKATELIERQTKVRRSPLHALKPITSSSLAIDRLSFLFPTTSVSLALAALNSAF